MNNIGLTRTGVSIDRTAVGQHCNLQNSVSKNKIARESDKLLTPLLFHQNKKDKSTMIDCILTILHQ